ncbi:phage major capsid protein [Streptomyces sp. HK10]|uniref:phage major capsid protein n=1 Tax=Streptomyces sp. HK10 TaxID=3373255 RepID=UPI003748318F
MAGYDNVAGSNADLLPIEWSNEVIKQMTETSAALRLSRRRTMSTRQARMAATSALAGAYWVGQSSNDFTDLKETTKAEWSGVNLIVEDLAVLVAIPHAYEQDNAFPVWEETRPQLVEAMGKALDSAIFFGVNKPATWPDDLMTSITAAGQTTTEGTGDDIAADVALSARVLKQRGFTTTGFAAEPGFGWELIGMRSTDGTPIYQRDLSGPGQSGLYGFPMQEVANGAWDSTAASVIHGDWSKSIIGIRQDITFTRHESGVITDETGAVVFNAMQQDSTVWRAVMRVAWARANPATRLGPNADTATGKFPFAAVVPASS